MSFRTRRLPRRVRNLLCLHLGNDHNPMIESARVIKFKTRVPRLRFMEVGFVTWDHPVHNHEALTTQPLKNNHRFISTW
jgi:hypothetical protein